MPLESILYLSFVISALAVFASALTYAEWATRQMNNEPDKAEEPGQPARRKSEETAPLRRAA
jgi:hypothetical protein